MILGEEVAASKLTIFDISKQICDAVQARAGQGLINQKLIYIMKIMQSCTLPFTNFDLLYHSLAPDKNHGVILIPEGIIESIPEVYALLKVMI